MLFIYLQALTAKCFLWGQLYFTAFAWSRNSLKVYGLMLKCRLSYWRPHTPLLLQHPPTNRRTLLVHVSRNWSYAASSFDLKQSSQPASATICIWSPGSVGFLAPHQLLKQVTEVARGRFPHIPVWAQGCACFFFFVHRAKNTAAKPRDRKPTSCLLFSNRPGQTHF